jgi:hypothetical protein
MDGMIVTEEMEFVTENLNLGYLADVLQIDDVAWRWCGVEVWWVIYKCGGGHCTATVALVARCGVA